MRNAQGAQCDLLGLADANSAEVDPHTAHAVARVPEDRICENDSRGATRMGASGVKLQPGRVRELYGEEIVTERHSNRYEIDPKYVQPLQEKGLRMVGTSMDAGYPEAFELDEHPFYVAVVYHPEYISRPNRPHPLFCALMRAAKAGR